MSIKMCGNVANSGLYFLNECTTWTSDPLNSTGTVSITSHVRHIRVCPSHGFISCWEHLRSKTLCWPDFVDLLGLCFFHYFSLIFVHVPWVSRLCRFLLCLFWELKHDLESAQVVLFWKFSMQFPCLTALFDAPTIKNRPGMYSPWSRAESSF